MNFVARISKFLVVEVVKREGLFQTRSIGHKLENSDVIKVKPASLCLRHPKGAHIVKVILIDSLECFQITVVLLIWGIA